jgi:antitoxin component YwqK of YwqJK toxin-antitoxin module
MKCVPAFRSSIPRGARERVLSRHANGAVASAEYWLGGRLVGVRHFDPEGHLSFDCGMKDSRRHGTAYRLDLPGRLLSATPYSRGLEHGIARQWSDDGRLLGTYRMNHGTGIDLWWDDGATCQGPSCPSRGPLLAEVHYMRRGLPHGYEWWIDDDQSSVHWERHWRNGELHGIEREWNLRGRLRRGFPKYFVEGRQVARRQYLRSAAIDRSLPPVRKEDNLPSRRFPAELVEHLGPAQRLDWRT